MTDMKRIMVSMDSDLAERVEELKKSMFYNRSYAELIRQVLRAGLEVFEQEGA